MNKKIKTIGAAVLAAVMCASFAGCSKEKDTGVYVDKDGNVSVNESRFEDHVNSVFGGNSNNPSSSTKPEEVKIAMTDEIKNASLSSGLVQYNNDIFQRGGYITVADFVEKYKDSYDITYFCPGHYSEYDDGPVSYDVGKDYLIEYDKDEDIFDSFLNQGKLSIEIKWDFMDMGTGMNRYSGDDYYLTLKPKNSSNGNTVIAYVVNASSPEEKITLDKAVVVEVQSSRDRYHDFITPEWFPMGLNCSEFKDEYESEKANYSAKNLGEILEAAGLKKNSELSESQASQGFRPSFKPDNFGTYWKNKYGFGCYILGEKNLFGAKPVYYYSFNIDKNTDKLDFVDCYLEYFIKE